MNRRSLVLAAALVSAILLVVLIFGPWPSREGQQIGILLPVNGPVASIGKPALQGVQLAIEEANKDRPAKERIIPILEDTQARPELAISAYLKLAMHDRPSIIVGPLTSGESTALLPRLEQKGIPVISPGASTASLDGKKDLFYRVELSDSVGGRKQAEIAFQRLNSAKISILYISNEYGQGLERVFRKTFSELGGQVLESLPFPPSSTDFRPILSRLSNSNADTLLLVGIDELVNIITQAREVGLRQKLFTTPMFENESYLSQLGQSAEGVQYVYYGSFDLNSQDRIVQGFISAYKARYGEPPTYYSALGYDAAKLAILAIQKAGRRPEPSGVSAALSAGLTVKGVTGDATLNQYGDVEKPVTLKTVIRGQFIPLRP
jgi:branched-chain amino acid transport system substrate-binding protein